MSCKLKIIYENKHYHFPIANTPLKKTHKYKIKAFDETVKAADLGGDKMVGLVPVSPSGCAVPFAPELVSLVVRISGCLSEEEVPLVALSTALGSNKVWIGTAESVTLRASAVTFCGTGRSVPLRDRESKILAESSVPLTPGMVLFQALAVAAALSAVAVSVSVSAERALKSEVTLGERVVEATLGLGVVGFKKSPPPKPAKFLAVPRVVNLESRMRPSAVMAMEDCRASFAGGFIILA